MTVGGAVMIGQAMPKGQMIMAAVLAATMGTIIRSAMMTAIAPAAQVARGADQMSAA